MILLTSYSSAWEINRLVINSYYRAGSYKAWAYYVQKFTYYSFPNYPEFLPIIPFVPMALPIIPFYSNVSMLIIFTDCFNKILFDCSIRVSSSFANYVYGRAQQAFGRAWALPGMPLATPLF